MGEVSEKNRSELINGGQEEQKKFGAIKPNIWEINKLSRLTHKKDDYHLEEFVKA